MNSSAPRIATYPTPTLGQLEDFHKVIDCVRAIDVSLDCDANTLSKSKEIVDQQIRNQSADWHTGLPESYADAFAVFVAGGDADLVLDRLSINSRTESHLARVVRSAWIYLGWMILLAAGGIAIFGAFSLPAIEAMRADMNLVPRHALRSMPAWFQYEASIVIVLVVVAFGLMGASMATRFPAWSAGWFGGNHYRRCRMRMIRSRVAKSLGDRTQGKSGLAAGKLFEQDYLQNQAVAQLSRLRVLVPIILIVFIGGMGVMTYCWMLFSPLIALIFDLSTNVFGEGVPK